MSKEQWVYRQFVLAIEGRLLKPGDAIPSTRVLSQRWKVSRGVVQQAYEQLRAEGYVSAAAGRGTMVAHDLPDRFLRAELSDDGYVRQCAPPVPSPIQHMSADAGSRGAIPERAFVARLPDAGLFDVRAWQACVLRASKRLDREVLGRFDPQGLPQLRSAICAHLALTRGIRCNADDVVIVTGIRHAIDLCTPIAVPAGGEIAVEDPGYAGARAIFDIRGFRSVPIQVDREGLVVQQLEAHPDIAMVYVTPAHQAPTGVTLSSDRRTELTAWADRRNAWILEDDYDSDFSYELAPPPALKSMDSRERVIFCGSFNKSMFSGLRIGYVVAPQVLIGKIASARAITGRSNSIVDQLALLEFIETGALQRHLKKARIMYKERRDVVLTELQAALGSAVSFEGTRTGFHFTLYLPTHVNEADAIDAAAKAGITVQGLGSFYNDRSCSSRPALVIGYTALSSIRAKWSARRLGAVLKQLGR